MRLLFINRVYPPAEGATGFLLQELAEALCAKGHQVTVVTSALSAAGEAIPSEGKPDSKHISPVEVIRVQGLPFTRASHLKRALAYLSLYPAFFLAALRGPKPDIIITLTDPPLQLVLGPFLRIFRRAKLVHWAQDVYPELAEELAVLKKGSSLGKILRFFSTAALKRYHKIIAVGRCMKDRLIERGLSEEKIVVIPNWAQESFSHHGSKETEVGIAKFKADHGLTGNFLVMYSGNFGLAHDFTAIIQAVQEMKVQAPEMRFVFVGGGPRKAWLQEQLAACPNVIFLPFQPKEMLEISLGTPDLHLASMKKELNGLVVPSKVYGILAAGKPCIFLGPANSEAGRFIHENNCGTVVASGDGHRLSRVIKEYQQNLRLTKEQGLNSLKAVKQVQFEVQLERFEQAFLDVRGNHVCS